MEKEKVYAQAGDGECQFTERCYNRLYNEELCFVCCYNTSATPRGYFKALSPEVELTEEEADMIES
jgi:hypothetical protein